METANTDSRGAQNDTADWCTVITTVQREESWYLYYEHSVELLHIRITTYVSDCKKASTQKCEALTIHGCTDVSNRYSPRIKLISVRDFLKRVAPLYWSQYDRRLGRRCWSQTLEEKIRTWRTQVETTWAARRFARAGASKTDLTQMAIEIPAC